MLYNLLRSRVSFWRLATFTSFFKHLAEGCTEFACYLPECSLLPKQTAYYSSTNIYQQDYPIVVRNIYIDAFQECKFTLTLRCDGNMTIQLIFYLYLQIPAFSRILTSMINRHSAHHHRDTLLWSIESSQLLKILCSAQNEVPYPKGFMILLDPLSSANHVPACCSF